MALLQKSSEATEGTAPVPVAFRSHLGLDFQSLRAGSVEGFQAA
jgi:hypothetical protein